MFGQLGKNPSPRWDLNPRTLRDLDHGGSWVQIPSGARIFSEFSKQLECYYKNRLFLTVDTSGITSQMEQMYTSGLRNSSL